MLTIFRKWIKIFIPKRCLPCFGLNAFRFWLDESDFGSESGWTTFVPPLLRFGFMVFVLDSLAIDKLALPAFILAVISSSFDNIRSSSTTFLETWGSNPLVDTITFDRGGTGLTSPLGGGLGLRSGFESIEEELYYFHEPEVILTGVRTNEWTIFNSKLGAGSVLN